PELDTGADAGLDRYDGTDAGQFGLRDQRCKTLLLDRAVARSTVRHRAIHGAQGQRHDRRADQRLDQGGAAIPFHRPPAVIAPVVELIAIGMCRPPEPTLMLAGIMEPSGMNETG